VCCMAPAQTAKTILEEASEIVKGDRAVSYGKAQESFDRIATMWTAILTFEVTPHDVAMCMIALKIARYTVGHQRDSLVDIAGYAQCAEMLDG
jgi:hypothetical protein